jgi:hypothetical protein
MSDDMSRRDVRTQMDLARWIARQTGRTVDQVVERMRTRFAENGREWRADAAVDLTPTRAHVELRGDVELERVRAMVSAALDGAPVRGLPAPGAQPARSTPARRRATNPKPASRSAAQLRAERHMRRMIR